MRDRRLNQLAAVLLTILAVAAYRQPSERGQVRQLQDVIKEMSVREKAYFDGGGQETDKARLKAYLDDTDKEFASSSDYNLAKGRVLQRLDDLDGWDTVFARIPDDDLKDPSDLFNRLQARYRSEPEVAVVLAGRLAAAPEPRARVVLNRWLHGSLAGQFAPERRPFADSEQGQRLLAALRATNNDVLKQQAAGLLRWLELSNAVVPESTNIALADFGTTDGLAPRYALLTAQRLAVRPGGDIPANRLRSAIIDTFDDRAAEHTGHRARERYWTAFAHATLADSPRLNRADRERHLLAAASLSMDAQDVGAGNEAETEATILGAAREFRSAYADYLESHGRRDEALRAYAELVALDLSKEDGLRERFTRLRPRQPFETWWSRTLPTLLPFAPTVSLRTFDGRELGTAQAPGTWTLLDFWGTWCAPCQPDMPKVDTLYRETLTSKRGRVITVAARDEAETVRAYLTSRNFSYPVVLADDALVNAFGITGFPTKLLIAPNGGMLRLPPDDSWESAARHRLSSEPLN